ncbi:hypothetical protein Tco_1087953 [Tanacetum coccineum]
MEMVNTIPEILRPIAIPNGEQKLQALVDGKKIIITEATIRRDLQLEDADDVDCLPNATIFEQLTLIGMVKNFDNDVKFLMYPRIIQVFLNNQLEGMATHNRIYIAPSHTKKIFANMRRQGKDFSGRVTPLFPTMVVQAQEKMGEGDYLKKRVKKLEKKGGSRTHKLKRLYRVGRSARVVSSEEASLGDQEDASKQGRKIYNIDADEDITLENVHDAKMFDVNDLDGDEVVVESKVTDKAGEKRNIVEEAVTVTDAVIIPVSAATITNVELTLAQTLVELKSARPKKKGVVMQEPKSSTRRRNIAWDDIQAKIDADYQVAKRLQAQEQQELTIEEKSTLFVQHLEKRKKHFAAKRVEEKRNRPPIRAQQRNIICTYLKNMAGWKPKDLKNKSFANIQELFDKAFKRVNTFVDFRTELVEGTEMEESSKKAEVMEESSSKRAGDELQQESTKKQKMDDDQERAELQGLMNVIPDEEEVAVDAIHLATKPPSIVDWKIVKEGKISYYHIIRADGSSRRLEEGYERVLWGDLKTMFEHHVEDAVYANKKLQTDHLNEMCYQLLKLNDKATQDIK